MLTRKTSNEENPNEVWCKQDPDLSEYMGTCSLCGEVYSYELLPDWRERLLAWPFQITSLKMFRHQIAKIDEHEECFRKRDEQLALERFGQSVRQIRESIQEEYATWTKRSALPVDFEKKTFETLQVESGNEKAVSLIKAWQEQDDFGFLLTGPAGSGKSHLAFCLLNRVLSKKLNPTITLENVDFFQRANFPAYYSASELLAKIKKSDFDFPFDLLNNDLVILDDIGAENITEWSREIFFRFFEHRLNKRLPTIVTTNLSLNELKDRLHERVLSRILALCIPLQITGRDRRRDILSDRMKALAARSGVV